MENSCIYGSKRIARASENFGKTAQSTREEIRGSFELITRRVSVVTVDVRLTQITGVRSRIAFFANEHTLDQCK